jgi:hypothetical protein
MRVSLVRAAGTPPLEGDLNGDRLVDRVERPGSDISQDLDSIAATRRR